MPRKKIETAPTNADVIHNDITNGIATLPEQAATELVKSLSRADVLTAAVCNREQAMALVGLYQDIQKLRVGASNKVSAHERRVDILADSALIKQLKKELQKVEGQAARGLEAYAEAQPLGKWCLSILGVGPIITAGLLAHIDLTKAPCPSSIWKFAGLLAKEDQRWEKGKKRPYNARLKTLCWLLGECFKRAGMSSEKSALTVVQIAAMKPEERSLYFKRKAAIDSPGGMYVRLCRERKEQEIAKNERGDLSGRAMMLLEEAEVKRRKLSEEQINAWSEGKLQPVGLDLRAKRFAVKIFLSHFFEVGREIMGLNEITPYIFSDHAKRAGLCDHVHRYKAPNWPLEGVTKAVSVD